MTNLDIESCTDCVCDYLTVYNGADQDAPLLDLLCGSTTGTYYSHDNNMFLEFVSDYIIEATGFRATVRFLPIHSNTTTALKATYP